MMAVDTREVQEAQDHHDLFIPDQLVGIPCSVQLLTAADYAFLDRDITPLGIERCEIGNLIQKMRSGELESQLLKCQVNYAKVILLIEGVYDQLEGLVATHKAGNRGYFRVHVYPHTYYDEVKALEVRLSELGVEVLSSPNFTCSMRLIRIIYNQRTKPEEEHTLFKKTRVIKIPTRWTTNPAVPKLMTLIPRLPEKVAIDMIDKFGSIWEILHAEESYLLEVEGFGKGGLKRLRDGMGKE